MSVSVESAADKVKQGEGGGAKGGGGASGGGGGSATLKGADYASGAASLEPKAEDEHGHSHGAEPEPGKADAAKAPERTDGADIPVDVRTSVLGKLEALPRSKATLDNIKKAKGNLDFPIKWSKQGTFHSSGSVFIRSTSTEDSWVGSLAHELVHLETFVTGNAANPKTDAKDKFVEKKMEDEINAQAACYIALMQKGEKSNGSQAGYDDWIPWVGKNHADLVKAKKWSEIEVAAKAWIKGKYKSEWVTNNTKENYYTYWGNHWDKVNAKK
ncbi:MAG: hypothetical protein CVU56_23300 [Deltaproteobacteria bacterium HGW-Deltaproteobacteria-14]|jgi:hypothetical protein|nr:MAG: hypothetical protein CVU56_23300 [Deltaproteobacteria bacterium HGW-Deltaproteobacteria-14]